MLCELDVRNYALIDRLSVSFGGGFNVLTGETGAGKSLIIDCVGLIIGGRASADAVRAGCDSAVVDAVFDVSGMPQISEFLSAQGIEFEPDGSLIVSRQVWRQGRSQCRVNGRAVTLSVLSQLGSVLVDIYGQHEYESLTRPGKHLALLDSYGGAEHLWQVAHYRKLWAQWQRVRSDLAELRSNAREIAQRVDILRYQVNEIREAALVADEDVSLAQEHHVMANSERLHDAAARAYSVLYEPPGPDDSSAYDMLADALAELESVVRIDPSLQQLKDNLSSICEQTTSLARALRSYRDSMDYDAQRLAAVEDRLALIAGLKRKYGDTVAEITQHGDEAAEELGRIEGADERIHELEDEDRALAAQLAASGKAISCKRSEVAAELSRDISDQLRGLSMPRAVFLVSVKGIRSDTTVFHDGVEVGLGPHGADDVEFMFSANAGEEPRPLARVASGGELSRVMLAIKSVLALSDDMPTMIFDEVDQGIGGEAAVAVAQRLQGIGKVRQVLAVTHLPQIAACGERHLSVEKIERDGMTEVSLRQLSEEQRVSEIARMLAGDNPSPLTLAHAREMLADGREV